MRASSENGDRLETNLTRRLILGAAPLSLAWAVCLVVGCAISEDERCDPGQEYVLSAQKWVCRPTSPADAAADTPTDAAQGGDVDTDAEQDVQVEAAQEAGGPTGQGAFCKTDADCTAFEASYCFADPQKGSGYCTVKDCDPKADACPQGFKCCDMPYPGVPNACASQTDYDALSGMGMCAK